MWEQLNCFQAPGRRQFWWRRAVWLRNTMNMQRSWSVPRLTRLQIGSPTNWSKRLALIHPPFSAFTLPFIRFLNWKNASRMCRWSCWNFIFYLMQFFSQNREKIDQFGIPPFSQLVKFRVTICTLTSSIYLYLGGLREKFTHIIIDEAPQASELDTLVPIGK